MKEILFNENSEKVLAILSKGAFLTTKCNDKVNTMTIAWGNIGFMWGKPVFTVMVRRSRHTYDLLEKSHEFTVSIPLGDMKAALGLCGSKSGRDIDKISATGLSLIEGQKITTPIIKGCGQHFECKVLYKTTMSNENLNAEVNEKCYSDNDYHTLYFGEILATYQE